MRDGDDEPAARRRGSPREQRHRGALYAERWATRLEVNASLGHNAIVTIVDVAGVHYRYAAARRRSAAREAQPAAVRPHGVALDGVDLALAEGTLTALLGPNGSGKSTLLRLIAGLDAPPNGTIMIAGATAGTRAAARTLGVVFQSPSLDPRLTVRENLVAHATLHGLRGDASETTGGGIAGMIGRVLADAALESHADRPVRTLSGGLARRADLARALLPSPRVLLLDEPTVGLDPAARGAFLDRVGTIVERDGVTVLLSTHLVDEAERTDRVVLMHRGRIVVDGAPNDLRAGLGRRVISVGSLERPDVDDPQLWRRRAGAWTIEPADEDQTQRLLGALLAGTAPVTIAPPTLADLFTRLTGDELEDAA